MSRNARSTLVEIEVDVITMTDKAILVTHDGDTETWIPKSMCEYEKVGRMQYVLTMEESFAADKGLV